MKSILTEKWLVCRVCLKQPKEVMDTIFDNSAEKDLTKMILECGGVPIKQFDHYPDKICSKCHKYLRIAYRFRITCQRSHKHLSKFIAPVEVDTPTTPRAVATPEMNSDTSATTVEDSEVVTTTTTTELLLSEEGYTEDLPFKLEQTGEDDDELDIKKELSDLEDDEIVDIYEPIDIDDVEIFEEIDDETIERSSSALSDEIEYLEDIIGQEISSDEDFVPSPKNEQMKKEAKQKDTPKQPRKGRGRPKGSRNLSAMTSGDKVKQPEKRGRKPKYPNITLYICDICGNTYPTQGRLTEHIKLHNGVKPHECEICGHAFAQTQQLARHMNTHTGNRPYKCNYCPAAFADLSTRNKHHRIHTNERPYICDVCGKAFSYTNTLKFHKMIHTGEKPFVCDICGKGFQQAYKLRNHKMTHEKRGIVKAEKVEVDAMVNFQEVHEATAQILEI